MKASALLNGQPAKQISITDRGLSYGDGVFRTLRIHAGKPQSWNAHWQRLQYDCERLDLRPPDQALLLSEAACLFSDGGEGVLKIIITRGSGGRGYGLPQACVQTRLLQRHPLPVEKPNQLVTLGVCTMRLSRNPRLAGIKHLNRLEQVLARAECDHAGWQEALLLDTQDWVISGTMSNLFLVKNNRILTPRLDQAGVIGATRQRIITLAGRVGLQIQETAVKLADCYDAQELFMCNSIKGVCPVVSLGEFEFDVGALTQQCMGLLQTDNQGP